MGSGTEAHGMGLLHLPMEILEVIGALMDARSLVSLANCCRAMRWHFKSRNQLSGLSVLEDCARLAVMRECHGSKEVAERWRGFTWLERAVIEQTLSSFDTISAAAQGFTIEYTADESVDSDDDMQQDFGAGKAGAAAKNTAATGAGTSTAGASAPQPPRAVDAVKLGGVGPKLLVSAESTADVKSGFLRWRLVVRGNQAVEFGVVPVSMQTDVRCLHKCLPGPEGTRPTGLASGITVGSLLPLRVALMSGSLVELLVHGGMLFMHVTQPEGGWEMRWINNRSHYFEYTGPRTMSFALPVDGTVPVKLAATCWSRAELRVLRGYGHKLQGMPPPNNGAGAVGGPAGPPPPPPGAPGGLPLLAPAAAALQQQAAALQQGVPAGLGGPPGGLGGVAAPGMVQNLMQEPPAQVLPALAPPNEALPGQGLPGHGPPDQGPQGQGPAGDPPPMPPPGVAAAPGHGIQQVVITVHPAGGGSAQAPQGGAGAAAGGGPGGAQTVQAMQHAAQQALAAVLAASQAAVQAGQALQMAAQTMVVPGHGPAVMAPVHGQLAAALAQVHAVFAQAEAADQALHAYEPGPGPGPGPAAGGQAEPGAPAQVPAAAAEAVGPQAES